jgi:hypothetical protein
MKKHKCVFLSWLGYHENSLFFLTLRLKKRRKVADLFHSDHSMIDHFHPSGHTRTENQDRPMMMQSWCSWTMKLLPTDFVHNLNVLMNEFDVLFFPWNFPFFAWFFFVS